MKTAILAILLAACAPSVDSEHDDADTYTATATAHVRSTTARATAYAACEPGDVAIDGHCRIRGFEAYIAADRIAAAQDGTEGQYCAGYAPHRGTLIADVECERAP